MSQFEEALDESGRLSETSLARINEALKDKFKGACASCGERHFSLSDRVYATHAMGPNRTVDLSNTFPLVIVQCNNCGNVVTFAARLLGLYKEIAK